MSSAHKKLVRESFRNDVFCRDNYKCRVCGTPDNKDNPAFDAHHICDRTEMPFGGYVKENGITLCASCHELAEEYHKTGAAIEGYLPNSLYALIGSSLEKAIRTAQRKG